MPTYKKVTDVNSINNSDGFTKQNIDATLTGLLNQARGAQDAGQAAFAAHLYLAAYFYSTSSTLTPHEDAIAGLKQAWSIACNSHEHTLAEYIYDNLEPHLTNDELDHCNQQLQSLTLDQLAEFGISRDSLKEVLEDVPGSPFGSKIVHVGAFRVSSASEPEEEEIDEEELIDSAQSILFPDGAGSDVDSAEARASELPASETGDTNKSTAQPSVALTPDGFVEVKENLETPGISLGEGFGFRTTPKVQGNVGGAANSRGAEDDGVEKQRPQDANVAQNQPPAASSAAQVNTPDQPASLANTPAKPAAHTPAQKGAFAQTPAPLPPNAQPGTQMVARSGAGEAAPKDFEEVMNNLGDVLKSLHEKTANGLAQAAQNKKQKGKAPKRLTYADIPGYKHAKDQMISFGIGLRQDPAYEKLVAELNEKHGLNSMPASDTIMFTGESREDVNKFMEATANETGLPTLKMSVEENMQGAMVLCLAVDSQNQPRVGKATGALSGPAVLCLEDVDLWMSAPEEFEGDSEFWRQSLAHGARHAIALISEAVANPQIYVLASISCFGDIDTFFADVLSPFSMVPIEDPTKDERQEIWENLRIAHPSLKDVSLTKLINYSANLSRFDMYTATREALEAAYKDGLSNKEFVPVTEDYLFERLSTFQPIESQEYQNMEDDVASRLRDELESATSLDELLGISGSGESVGEAGGAGACGSAGGEASAAGGAGASSAQDFSANGAQDGENPATPPDFSL